MNTAKMARRQVGRAAALMYALLATVLVCHTARAQTGTSVTVKTLSGGPSQQSSSFAGNADGDTALIAQFNTPGGLALDSAGKFLYVADTGNNSIRQLDLSGNVTTTIISALDIPVDVATDASTNLYVLVQGSGGAAGFIRVYDQFYNYRSNFNAVALSKPTALALDSSGNAYVTETGGAVKRVGAGTGAVAVVVPAGTLINPSGVEVLDDGRVVVSDTGNYAIRVISPLLAFPANLALYAGLPGTPGLTDGVSNIVRFSAPRHIGKAGAGAIVVADGGGTVTQSQKVRVVDSSGNVGTLYGVNPANWASAFPGWLDSGDALHPPEAREPNGVVVDGSANVYVSEDFYHILRKVTSTGLVAPGGTSPTGGGSNVVINPPSLVISPNTGFFPMGQTITISSTSTNVYYTTDGSVPTTNSTLVLMSGGVGTIQFSSGTNDLTALRVTAFTFNGAAFAQTNVSGFSASATTIGVVTGVQPTIVAGIGSTVVVPVVLNLRTNDQIHSLQFRVEISPGAGAPPAISSQFRILDISSNDFITVGTSDKSGGVATFNSFGYSIGTTTGLEIAFIGTNANYSVKNFAVAALLAVPIPVGAAVGNTYTIALANPTATADGLETPVIINPGPVQTILVSNVSYVVGDTSPGRWYNAGDFGSGNLNNNDVNNAFYASLGVRIPYTFSDAFDAMDVFPEDSPGTVGGDGQIRFLDWQIILLRSLRLNTNPVFGISTTNWSRSWSAGGVRVNNGTTLNGSAQAVAKSTTLLPGSVWNRQAAIGALPLGNFQPGSTAVLPVFVNVYPGVAAPVSGLEFNAVVTPNGDAPALTSAVQFISSPLLGNSFATSLNINKVGLGWNLNTMSLAAASSNFLGWVQFPIPATAQPGQSYTVQFDHVDGAPNLTTQYDFESFSSTITVGSSGISALSQISDEWKIHFFGSVTNPQADPNADPDGDGVPNWMEFLMGTDPTDAASHLSLGAGGLRNGGQNVALDLLSAPGKVYVLEMNTNVVGGTWTPVLTNIGDGSVKEFIRANAGGDPQFYRIRVQH